MGLLNDTARSRVAVAGAHPVGGHAFAERSARDAFAATVGQRRV